MNIILIQNQLTYYDVWYCTNKNQLTLPQMSGIIVILYQTSVVVVLTVLFETILYVEEVFFTRIIIERSCR